MPALHRSISLIPTKAVSGDSSLSSYVCGVHEWLKGRRRLDELRGGMEGCRQRAGKAARFFNGPQLEVSSVIL
jgi:hypothetical protein